jgi:SAM-dependent methyltransferase
MNSSNEDAESWNRQFAAGEWAYLRHLDELAHHSIVAGYIAYLGRSLAVLDIACGEGGLRLLLPHSVRYCGSDWSAVAIDKARSLENEATRFVVADAETFVPAESFDIIVFNECLYYFQSAAETLRRYAQHLAPRGHLIISMYEAEGNKRIWESLAADFATVDRVHVSNAKGTAWNVALMAPRLGSN